ncbi:hypothetical protein CSUI_011404 [Cystoisospora suis]|uniref:Uncharacterized protein n=1 Tax=Cystoisospora suis TaxID=483139 RepID=A0A2C6KEL9_9APIC|nr:hypothetical protein CSUI_011404 [Cystoisospora suis]
MGMLPREGEGIDGVMDEVTRREEKKKKKREQHMQSCLTIVDYLFRISSNRLLSWGLRSWFVVRENEERGERMGKRKEAEIGRV